MYGKKGNEKNGSGLSIDSCLFSDEKQTYTIIKDAQCLLNHTDKKGTGIQR